MAIFLENQIFSIVVPVYKEEANLLPFIQRLEDVLMKMTINNYEIIFCLDPSPDNTERILRQEVQRNSSIKLLIFSRRFGQPAATMAGIFHCKGNVCVIIDCDLQDPPELIQPMYTKLQEGYDVVYAKRCSRKGESWIKKSFSYFGYFLIAKLSDVEIPRNTGDFRIITRRVIEELRRLRESHGFLRGLIAYVGFRQTSIEYNREVRLFGRSNYNRFIGSIKIGLNGVIGFSSRPLQCMSLVGSIMAGFSFLLGIWYIFQKLSNSYLTPGLSTTILAITFFSGIQLLSLGLIGEYVSRIYDEVKKRPLYIIDEIVESKPRVTSDLLDVKVSRDLM